MAIFVYTCNQENSWKAMSSYGVCNAWLAFPETFVSPEQAGEMCEG